MKKLKDLKRRSRNWLVICSWLPLVIFALVCSALKIESSEPIIAIITLLFLALGIVMTTLIVKINKEETKQKKLEEENKRKLLEEARKKEEQERLDKEYQEKFISLPIKSKVVGVVFEGRQQFIKKSKVGDKLIISHTPTNEYPNTISVINERTQDKLGVLKSELADKLLFSYKKLCHFNGIILEITGGSAEYPTLGCNIKILEQIFEDYDDDLDNDEFEDDESVEDEFDDESFED